MKKSIPINHWDIVQSKLDKFGTITKSDLINAFEIGDPMSQVMQNFVAAYLRDEIKLSTGTKNVPFKITKTVLDRFEVLKSSHGADEAREILAGELGLGLTTLKKQISIYKKTIQVAKTDKNGDMSQ